MRKIKQISLTLTVIAMMIVISAGQTLAQTQPEWGRAYSPAEGREMMAEIAQLSIEKGLQRKTLSAIALALGASRGNLSFVEIL
jgi:hypothetical protein